MSKNSDVSNLSRRRFLAAAGTVAAANSFVAAKAVSSDQNAAQATPPPASMNYTITIEFDPTSTTGLFSYSAKDQHGNDVPLTSNSLTVYAGDQVKWKAHTSGSGKFRASVRFTTTSPFRRAFFAWSENGSDGDTVLTAAIIQHYYVVAILHRDTGEVYADDPKIIVGGRGLKAEIDQAESELRVVQDKVKSVIELLEKAGKDAKTGGKNSSS